MYKVFIYDKPVYLTSDANFTEKNCQQLKGVNVDKIIRLLEEADQQGVIVLVKDLKVAWKAFKKSFKYIKAAGGIVLNTNQEVLCIHRLGKWDLPKGKLEKNESIEACALREIEEECNVNQLKIINEIPSTYHCYPYKGKWALKRTYWYKVSTTFAGNLIPQTEEGIEKVEWIREEKLDQVFQDTYRSILEVLKHR